MSENPRFPEGDNAWFDGLLSGFGEPQPTGVEVPTTGEVIDPDADLDALTPAELERIGVATFYFRYYYPNPEMEPPKSMDNAALGMMRTYAHFLHNGSVKVEGEPERRLEEKYPDFSLRHINQSARFNRRTSQREMNSLIEGGEAHRAFGIMHKYYGILAEISSKAMEFEEARKKGSKGES